MTTFPPILIKEDGMVRLPLEDGTFRETDLHKVLGSAANSEVAPRGCRFTMEKNGMRVYVIEQEPRTRTIQLSTPPPSDQWTALGESGRGQKYHLTEADQRRCEFTLAFPYTIFFICFQGEQIISLRVFFRDQPILSFSDHLFVAFFTQDDLFHPPMDEQVPPQDRIPACFAERAIDWFWHQTFSPTIGAGYRTAITQLQSMWDWEYYSRGDYLWVLRARWQVTSAVNDQVERLFAGGEKKSSAHELIYWIFLQNVMHAQGSLEEKTGEQFLPTLSTCVGQDNVRLGDVVRCQPMGMIGMPPAGEYVILGFLKHINDTVYVRLEGVEKGVVIGSRRDGWKRGFELVKPQPKPSLKEARTTGGELIQQGMKFSVTDQKDLYLDTDRIYRISGVYVDEDGDIQVEVPDLGEKVYLTHKGGTLFSSVRFIVPTLQGKTFRYGNKEISIGQVVKITRSPYQALASDTVLRVSSLSKAEEKPGYFFIGFEGIAGTFPLMENGDLMFEWKGYPYEHSATKIVFGEHTFDLTFGRCLLAVKSESGLVVGHLYHIVDIVLSTRPGHHPLDLDIIFEYGNAPIPLIQQSKWRLTDGTIAIAADTYTQGETRLRRGQNLRYSGRTRDHLSTNTDVTILCFVRSSQSEYTNVVFTNGTNVVICQDLMRDMGQERIRHLPDTGYSIRLLFTPPPIISEDLASMYAILDKKGNRIIGRDRNDKSVTLGSLVRCTQRSFESRAWDERAVTTSGLVVHSAETGWGSKFYYLYYPFIVREDGYNSETCGSSGLQREFCDRHHILLSLASNCEIVFDRIVQPESKQPSITIRSCVQMKEGLQNPIYGWGEVRPQGKGIVVEEKEPGVFVVDFPNRPGFYAEASDLKVV